MNTPIVIIDGNAFCYGAPGQTSMLHMPVNADGTLPDIHNLDNWSGEIEPPYDALASAADRALFAMDRDAHLAAYLAGRKEATKLSPRAAWPFPGDDKP